MGLMGFASPNSSKPAVFFLFSLVLSPGVVCNGGKTSTYRRKLESTMDMPFDSDVFEAPHGYNAPQQVHITQGDQLGTAMIVSWVTVHEPGSSKVVYWSANSKKKTAEGEYNTYKYYDYKSPYIHHVKIRNLKYDTKYYYEVGIGHTKRQFWFVTPPAVGPDAPYTFGLIGDLGQTYDSNKTLTCYENNSQMGHTVLCLGDLAYADDHPNHDNNRWDSWGRFLERSVAYQPWFWLQGIMNLIMLQNLFISEMFLRGDSVIIVLRNPK